MNSILYISGFGRCGSSILDQYVSHYHNFFSVGEVTYFIERGIIYRELCSCGKTVFDCEFWSKVIERLGYERLCRNAEWYAKCRDRYESTSRYPYYLYNRDRIQLSDEWLSYIHLQDDIYQAIFNAIDDPEIVLVDSSKYPSRGLWMNELKEYKVYILHMLRDPVANSVSWTRRLRRPEASYNGSDVYMIRMNYWVALLKWIMFNLSSNSGVRVTLRSEFRKMTANEEFPELLPAIA